MAEKHIAQFEVGFHDAYSKVFSKEYGKPVTAKTVTFIVTEGCTLRCTYCYEVHKHEGHRMSFETAKKAVDWLYAEDMSGTSDIINDEKANALIIEFIGGEPLMEIDLMHQIAEYFIYKGMLLDHRWQYNYKFSITSNGTEYFDPRVQAFLDKYGNKVSMGITIDGNKELHDACRVDINGNGSFDIVQRAFKDALRRGVTSSTKLTIAPDNLPYLFDALVELYNYDNITSVAANPIHEHNWTYEEAFLYYTQLIKLADWLMEDGRYGLYSTTLFTEYIGNFQGPESNQNYCGGTGAMISFSYNGGMYPCTRYVPFALSFRGEDDEMRLGDVDTGWLKTDKAKATFAELEAITRRSQSTDECWECPISTGCGWCSAWNYDLYGTANKRNTFICNMHKARVMANSYFYNKIHILYDETERMPLNIPDEWALQIIDQKELDMLREVATPPKEKD